MATEGMFAQLWGAKSISYQKLFLDNYDVIRSICRGFGQLGVAVIAIDRKRGGVAGSACIAARVDRASAAIIGRHGLADVYLEDDHTLSLRHLAVILHPVKSWEPQDLKLSVLDLRTPLRFASEYGDQLAGLVAEGPVFVSAGRYAVLCLVTGDETDWPARGEDAWDMLPARHYVDVQVANAASSPRQQLRPALAMAGRRPKRISQITLVDGPEMAQALMLTGGESIAGHLTTTSFGRSRTLPIGDRALDRGVLIGRNPRCDQHDLLIDQYISRVHLMLRRVGDRIYAIDIASTGRTFATRKGKMMPVRLLQVDGPLELYLAQGRARVTWQPMQRS